MLNPCYCKSRLISSQRTGSVSAGPAEQSGPRRSVCDKTLQDVAAFQGLLDPPPPPPPPRFIPDQCRPPHLKQKPAERELQSFRASERASRAQGQESCGRKWRREAKCPHLQALVLRPRVV